MLTLNLKHNDVIQHIGDVIKEKGDLYGNVRITVVSVLEDTSWKNAICVAQIFPRGAEPSHRKSLRYPKVHLLEEWIDKHNLCSFLDQVTAQKLIIDGEEVLLHQNITLSQWRFEAGGNEFSQMAGFLYESGTGGPFNVFTEPLLAFELPFFSDVRQATQKWIGLKNSDSRLGSVIVFAPECRAGFAALNAKANKLTIVTRSVNEELGQSLKIKGAWTVDGKNKSFEVSSNKEVMIDIPEGAQEVEFYLLGSAGKVFDYHRETKYWVKGHSRILGMNTTDKNLQNLVDHALSSGECEKVEFKPFIEIGNKKWNEVLNTVISFANTKGGIIIFGIDNHCAVTGVERQIHELGRKENIPTFDDAVERYKGEIKRLIGDNINRGLKLDISVIKLDGHQVIALLVPEGQDKPYAHVRSNDIFIRRGSNNVRPDPDTELPSLISISKPTLKDKTRINL